MTNTAQQRVQRVRSSGLVSVKKSGMVSVDWNKAVRSPMLKEEIKGMVRIRDKNK